MEKIDIINKVGKKTGKVIARGDKMEDNEFFLAIHIWIKNSKGELLIQKRKKDKLHAPGLWAPTAGTVQSGDVGKTTVLREVEEELGFKISEDTLELIGKSRVENFITEVWIVNHDIDLLDIVIQKSEVDDVKWVSIKELKELIEGGMFYDYCYMNDFFRYLNTNGSSITKEPIIHTYEVSQWENQKDNNFYTSESLSSDGFIHCCTSEQLEWVFNRFYKKEKEVVVITLNPEKLTSRVIYEDFGNFKSWFPHIYGPINKEAVVNTTIKKL
jgi:uncharacterized protein (DUF952 family)/isopentenyldiphosphate isomerase